MKVSAFGEFDSANLGDQLIGQGIKILFDDLGHSCTPYPLEAERPPSGDLPTNARPGLLRRWHRWLYKEVGIYTHSIDAFLLGRKSDCYNSYIRPIIEQSGLVVIGGGQLLSDRTIRMQLRIYYISKLCRALNRPAMFLGVGISQPRTFASRLILKQIMKNMSGRPMAVRDGYSATVARSLHRGHGAMPMVLPDCAVPAIVKLRDPGIVPSDPAVVGLAPMSHLELPTRIAKQHINSLEWWAELATKLIGMGFAPKLFCTGNQTDFAQCTELAALLETRGVGIELLPRPETTDEFICHLQSMAHLLCQRLHASISFYALGSLPTSLGWDRKVEEFYGGHGMMQRVLDKSTDPGSAAALITSGGGRPGQGEVLLGQLRDGLEIMLKQAQAGDRAGC